MELFALFGWDGPQGRDLRKIHREAHLARLREMDAQGRVVIAGPLTDGAGSLLVMRFSDRNEAEAWMNADPYVTEGIFERTEVRPFLQVFPSS